MSSTFEFLAEYLNSHGLPYTVDPICLRVSTWVRLTHFEAQEIVFQTNSDGALLHIELPRLLHVKDHVYKGVIFQSLLSLLGEQRMLRFAYDPTSGEIYASIDLFLLKNAQLTHEQIDLHVSNLIYQVDHLAMPRLKQILAIGEDPGQISLNASHQQQQDS